MTDLLPSLEYDWNDEIKKETITIMVCFDKDILWKHYVEGLENNMKTVGYLDEIQQVFPDAKSKGKLIYATNSRNIDSATNTCGIAVGMDTLDYDDLYEY